MISAIILLCVAGTAPADCTPESAFEVQAVPLDRADGPIVGCLALPQSILAAEAGGARADGAVKVVRCMIGSRR